MARKRLKVFDYQHIIEQLRGGISGRQIARLGVASRNKIADVKAAVEPLGWLDPEMPMPPAKDIEALLVLPESVPVIPSKVEPYWEEVLSWVEAGRTPKQIWRKLQREKTGRHDSYAQTYLGQSDLHHGSSTQPSPAKPSVSASGRLLPWPRSGDVYR